jgi:hypothetical protein
MWQGAGVRAGEDETPFLVSIPNREPDNLAKHARLQLGVDRRSPLFIHADGKESRVVVIVWFRVLICFEILTF